MKKKIANAAILIVALIFLSVLAFYVRIGSTADSIAILKTTGMTCSSCSSSITKALETVKGVALTEVDIEGGWVIVGYDTKTVKAESLAEKINGAGFGSNVYRVLTPEQYKQITGVDFGNNALASRGCGGCGSNGGCGTKRQN